MDNKEKFKNIVNGGNGYSVKEMLAIHMKTSDEFRTSVLNKLDGKISSKTFWGVIGLVVSAIGLVALI